MEQHNIGTDATVAEHIQKQLDRGYATKDGNMTFWPTSLGEALVGAYRKMGLENLWLPNLRWAFVRKKRKEKTTPFGVNLMRSQVLYRAAQVLLSQCWAACLPSFAAKIRILRWPQQKVAGQLRNGTYMRKQFDHSGCTGC